MMFKDTNKIQLKEINENYKLGLNIQDPLPPTENFITFEAGTCGPRTFF